MGYRGMHVVDSDAHYLEEIRDFAKYLKGPAVERFADWSGRYHMPALVGEQYDVMLHGRTVRGRRQQGGGALRARGGGRHRLPHARLGVRGQDGGMPRQPQAKSAALSRGNDGEDIYVILPGR